MKVAVYFKRCSVVEGVDDLVLWYLMVNVVDGVDVMVIFRGVGGSNCGIYIGLGHDCVDVW